MGKGSGLVKAPPKAIEAMVAILIPPACREEVLGDLHERFTSTQQYIADSVFAVPCVVASRIRRTTDSQILAMEAFAVYLSFLCAAWQWAGRAFLGEQRGLIRLAIPTVAALIALILRRAYAVPGRRSRWAPFLDGAAGTGGAVLSQAALWNIERELVLPLWILISGCATSVLLLAALRMVLALHESGGQAAVGGDAAMSPKDVRQKSQNFVRKVRRGNVSLWFAAILVAGVLLFLMRQDAAFHSRSGWVAASVIIAVALYMIVQVYRKGWSGETAPPEASASRDYYRAQLERRRAALRSIWWWYVGPMLAILLTFALQVPFSHPDEPNLWMRAAPFVLLTMVWCVGFGYICRREARDLQREIEVLDKE